MKKIPEDVRIDLLNKEFRRAKKHSPYIFGVKKPTDTAPIKELEYLREADCTNRDEIIRLNRVLLNTATGMGILTICLIVLSVYHLLT